MTATRRRFLGTALLALSSGCSSLARPGDEAGPQPGSATPTSSDDAPASSRVEFRLAGPDVDRRLFDGSAVVTVGELREREGRFALRVSLDSDATSRVADQFRTLEVGETPGAFEVVVRRDGRVVTRFGVSPSLAAEVTGSDWAGVLQLTFDRRSAAVSVRESLT